jgi:hypothetical protein
MSPFPTWLTGFGKPKCENIRKPRDFAKKSSPPKFPKSLESLEALLGPAPDFFGVEGAGGNFDPDLGRDGPDTLGAFFAADLAARCCSCIALRCLLCSALLTVGCGLGCWEFRLSPFGAGISADELI